MGARTAFRASQVAKSQPEHRTQVKLGIIPLERSERRTTHSLMPRTLGTPTSSIRRILMEKMLWLQKETLQVSVHIYACCSKHWSHADLLLDRWFSLVEDRLWFLFPIFITLYASSELFTWIQRRSAQKAAVSTRNTDQTTASKTKGCCAGCGRLSIKACV